MKLYFHPASPSCRRVLLTAEMAGVALDKELVDLMQGEQKAPQYMSLNPSGTVPTLVDGSTVLTDSRAIMQLLAAREPSSGLLPRDERARAEVLAWQFWDAAHLSGTLHTLGFEKLFKGMLGLGAPDGAKVQEALASFRQHGAVLEKRLQQSSYLVGARVTLADLTIAGTLMYAGALELPLAELPSVQTWFGHMTDLPAWQATQ